MKNSTLNYEHTLSEVASFDVSPIFWEVDDFYRAFELQWPYHPQLPSMSGKRLGQSNKLSRSEVMTMVIAFHGSGYRILEEF